MTTLYRAVGPEELADIKNTGKLINRGSAEGKYFTTSSEHASDYTKLDQLCAVCDNPKTGHVSIKPKDMSQMQGWIDSRGNDTTHPLTQELMDTVVNQVKK